VGFDGERALVLLAIFIIAGTSVFLFVAVRSFVRFTDDGVAFGRPLSFGVAFYKYTRVREIEHRVSFRAPIGNLVQRPHYVVQFDDGESWSRRDFLGAAPEEAGRIARFVASRSGRAIVERP
jgi:hypothetical protein